MDLPPLDGGVLRVLRADGEAAGAGFLVTGRLALTCAHVIQGGAVGVRVWVDSGRVEGAGPVPATVLDWRPGPDVAVLRLDAPLPGARPVPLVETRKDMWGHPIRTLGFPARHRHGIWHAGVLRERQGDGWLQFERAVDGGYAVGRGFSGAPVWDDRLSAVIGMVVAADAGNPVAFLIPTDQLVEAVPLLREVVGLPSPFPGLAAFQESDAEFFFGRAAESGEIAELVLEHPRVTVFGASGCGKSSVARAGVVPRLRAAGFATVVVRDREPRELLDGLVAELTALLRPELRGAALRREIRETRAELAEGGLPDLVAQVREARSVRGLVVVVDQLEELLTRGAPAAEIGVLWPEQPPDGLRVLATLRADFLEAVEEHPVLRRALRGRPYLLAPMTPAQLREAVTGPVERIPAVSYQPDLEQRVLDDAGEAPGVLPLLGFTLDRLWQEQRGGQLTQEAYTRLGGVRGALAQHADDAWKRCVPAGEDGERAARRLLTRLVRLPLGTPAAVRRTVPRSELGDAEWAIARALAAERLLVIGVAETDGERWGTVELAHEALITAWPRLREWTEQDRAFLTWREGVRQDRERWEAASRPADLLPGATALAAATRWEIERGDDLDTRDREFLAQGRARSQRQARRRRRLFVSFGVVAALVAVLGSLFVYQTGVSRDRAADAESRGLAAASLDTLESDPALAIMYAIAAYQRAPTEAARDALLQSYLAYGEAEVVMSGPLGGIDHVAASGDGRVVLTSTNAGRATLFTREEDGRLRQQLLPREMTALHPFVSPDGERAGYVSQDAELVWYELGEPLGDPHVIRAPQIYMENYLTETEGLAAISRDADRVVAATDNTLVWWDLDRGTRADPVTLSGYSFVNAVWFGRDQDTVLAHAVTDDLANHVLAVDLATGQTRRLTETTSDGPAVSGDGTTVAYCRDGEEIELLDTADGTVRYREEMPYGCFSPDALDYTGRYYADDTSVFDLSADGGPVELTRVLPNPVIAADDSRTYRAVLRDGDQPLLLVASSTAMVLLEQPTEPQDADVFNSVGLTPDGERIIGYLDDGRLRVVEANRELRELLTVERPGATYVPEAGALPPRFSADGTLLADRVAEDRFAVRDAETLEVLSEVSVEPPPEDRHPNTLEDINHFFADDHHLVTVSAAVVERWDALTGERVGRVDLGDLGLLSDAPDDAGYLQVVPYREEGHVAVTNGGPEIRVVDLGAGREVTELRADTGEGVNVARYSPDGDQLAILRKGSVWELWSTDPPRRELGPVGNLCPGGCSTSPTFAISFLQDGRFLVASGSQVRLYKIGSAVPVERYDLGVDGIYQGVSGDGHTVLYGPEDYPTPGSTLLTAVELDRPEQWRAALCEAIGWRVLSEAELGDTTTDLLSRPPCDPT
ncbi:hypothetical protein E1265_05790 [Streptomyces sp. 8K308]|uniref:nSTAND1 domain-containing NTPase n=1 Tax=Streptomyces sp. 8K308 TaxID=2530388 RepID=UPI00104AD88F|nr:trypsin-like peptidase domain-containing protein [Streptomyces sp. 8K308]TDC25888.1 hypothetical protein E1265_05790 [Streptomyces sp. 8K308]